MYEFLYTAIGQAIAAYAPNAVFASLINPLVIVTLVSFCGVVVPYSQIQPFWRYWYVRVQANNASPGTSTDFVSTGSTTSTLSTT